MREEKNGKNQHNRSCGRQESNDSGKNYDYHLGYNLGFESGFEKGYAEGSVLGYNNGFLAAMRLSEENGPEEYLNTGLPYNIFFQTIAKLVETGQINILLSGGAAQEAEILFKLLHIYVQINNKDVGNCP